MRLDRPVNDGQSKSRASRLAGDKRFEQSITQLGRNARAVIGTSGNSSRDCSDTDSFAKRGLKLHREHILATRGPWTIQDVTGEL